MWNVDYLTKNEILNISMIAGFSIIMFIVFLYLLLSDYTKNLFLKIIYFVFVVSIIYINIPLFQDI